MASTAFKNARMELKTTLDIKKLLTRAALLSGMDLTSFVLSSAETRAREVCADHEALKLSEEDQLRLFEALENPPEPTEELKVLMRSERLAIR